MGAKLIYGDMLAALSLSAGRFEQLFATRGLTNTAFLAVRRGYWSFGTINLVHETA